MIALVAISSICGIISSFCDSEIAVAKSGVLNDIGRVHVLSAPVPAWFKLKYFPPWLVTDNDVSVIPCIVIDYG